jgi:predicted negative regulator of RcsB-dependent stress response
MADDYLSDQEQEEALRNWWRENWRWIIGGVALGLAMLVGWRYWEVHRDQQATAAAKLYADLQSALSKQDLNAAAGVLATLSGSHDASAYAQQGRLLLAKSQVDGGKVEEAIGLLQDVIEKSKDEGLVQIARLRMARLLIQQGKFDDALKILKPESAGEFAAQVREIRGDALFAKNDRDGARAEYAAALAANANAQVDRTLLELKMQEVGEAPAPAPQGLP